MKRIILLIAILTGGQTLMAQSVKFGLKTTLSRPTLQSQAPFGANGNSETNVRLQISALADIAFSKISLQPGVALSYKGNHSVADANFVSNGSPVPYRVDQYVNLTYIEVPLNAVYHYKVKTGSFYAGAGSYAAFAVGGKNKNIAKQSTYRKRSTSEDIQFGEEADQIKSTDYGANVLAGYRLNNGLNVGLNYGLGLSNISNASDIESYNRVLGFSFGYFF